MQIQWKLSACTSVHLHVRTAYIQGLFEKIISLLYPWSSAIFLQFYHMTYSLIGAELGTYPFINNCLNTWHLLLLFEANRFGTRTTTALHTGCFWRNRNYENTSCVASCHAKRISGEIFARNLELFLFFQLGMHIFIVAYLHVLLWYRNAEILLPSLII